MNKIFFKNYFDFQCQCRGSGVLYLIEMGGSEGDT